MYIVYVLKSNKNNFIYVGSTEDIEIRLKLHNSGKVKSTKPYKPWELMEIREFETRSQAMKEEMFFKNWPTKRIIKKEIL